MSQESKQSDSPVRRVVTGETPDGRSKVWIDGPALNVKRPTDRVTSVLLWATEGAPADFGIDQDAGDMKLGTSPPPSGTRFVHFTLAPGEGVTEMHRTDTLDYMACVAGELTMVLDDEEVVLKAGDVLIGRGTNHAWANHGETDAVAIGVALDGRPKREGSMSGDEQAR